MVKGYFVLINKLGQVSRTFQWDKPEMTLVLRDDTGRLETHESTTALDELGISYQKIGTYAVNDVIKKPIEIGSLGTIEFVVNIDRFSPAAEPSPEEEDRLMDTLRWTAIGHILVVALLLIGSYFFREEPLPEPQIVQVFEQKKEEKKPKKAVIVDASEKRIKPHQKKVVVKPEPKKIVETKASHKVKVKNRTADKMVVSKRKQVDIGKVGALGVLGAPNANSKRAGGFDISKISNRRVGGSGGSVATSGSQKTFFGQGLVAASPGTGDKAQMVGGYGTRGKAGGRSGYGQISLVGSGAAFSSPVDSEAIIEGGLDRDQIAAVIRRHIGEIRFCYEKGLQVEPDLSGRVAVRFVIGANGGVNVASVAHSSLQDSKVENCVVGRLRTWRFPKPIGGVNVRVTYPFVLKRVSQG